jgi:rhodanese-related sulfurtransferase
MTRTVARTTTCFIRLLKDGEEKGWLGRRGNNWAALRNDEILHLEAGDSNGTLLLKIAGTDDLMGVHSSSGAIGFAAGGWARGHTWRLEGSHLVSSTENGTHEGKKLTVREGDNYLYCSDGDTVLEVELLGELPQHMSQTSSPSQTSQPSALYKIAAATAGDMVLDVKDNKFENDTPIILHKSHGGANQKFQLKPAGDGVFTIAAATAGDMVLDMRDLKDDTPIILYKSHGGANQKFQLILVDPGT